MGGRGRGRTWERTWGFFGMRGEGPDWERKWSCIKVEKYKASESLAVSNECECLVIPAKWIN